MPPLKSHAPGPSAAFDLVIWSGRQAPPFKSHYPGGIELERWRKKLLVLIAAGVVSCTGLISAPLAQECVSIESLPEHSTLTVSSDAAVTSTAPATFCKLEANRSYLLTVSRANFEQRTLRFSYEDLSAQPDIGGIRLGRLGRSLVLPGWGQYSLGCQANGAEAFAFVVLAAAKTNQAYADYRDAKDEYEKYEALLEEAKQQQVIEQARENFTKAAKTVNVLRDHSRLTAAVAGWIYAGNLFETLLLASPPRTTLTGGNSFAVEIPRRSRARAAFRSFLFPGMGQKYYGEELKGLFFQAGFVVMAYFTLDAKMRYDLSAAEYDIAYARYEEFKISGTVQEIAAAQADARAKFDIKDENKKDVYTYAVSAGAIWFLNFLDAIVFGGAGEEPDRFEVDTSFESSGVRTGLRFNF